MAEKDYKNIGYSDWKKAKDDVANIAELDSQLNASLERNNTLSNPNSELSINTPAEKRITKEQFNSAVSN
jgi:hypothetical protein